MPYQKVLPKFSRGELHSGSKHGPVVTNPEQAVAIMLSEKRKDTHSLEGLKRVVRK